MSNTSVPPSVMQAIPLPPLLHNPRAERLPTHGEWPAIIFRTLGLLGIFWIVSGVLTLANEIALPLRLSDELNATSLAMLAIPVLTRGVWMTGSLLFAIGAWGLVRPRTWARNVLIYGCWFLALASWAGLIQSALTLVPRSYFHGDAAMAGLGWAIQITVSFLAPLVPGFWLLPLVVLNHRSIRPWFQRTQQGPVGLGGWMILPMIGLVLGLLECAGAIVGSVLGMANTHASNEIVAAVVLLVAGSLQLLLTVGTLVAILSRRRAAPWLMITQYITRAIFTAAIIGIVVATMGMGARLGMGGRLEEGVVGGTMVMLAITYGSIPGMALWMTYFMVSRRVQATFAPRPV